MKQEIRINLGEVKNKRREITQLVTGGLWELGAMVSRKAVEAVQNSRSDTQLAVKLEIRQEQELAARMGDGLECIMRQIEAAADAVTALDQSYADNHKIQ